MRFGKKAVAILVAVMMLMTLFTMTAMAEDGNESPAATNPPSSGNSFDVDFSQDPYEDTDHYNNATSDDEDDVKKAIDALEQAAKDAKAAADAAEAALTNPTDANGDPLLDANGDPLKGINGLVTDGEDLSEEVETLVEEVNDALGMNYARDENDNAVMPGSGTGVGDKANRSCRESNL